MRLCKMLPLLAHPILLALVRGSERLGAENTQQQTRHHAGKGQQHVRRLFRDGPHQRNQCHCADNNAEHTSKMQPGHQMPPRENRKKRPGILGFTLS